MSYITGTINILKIRQGQEREQLNIQQSSRTSLWKSGWNFLDGILQGPLKVTRNYLNVHQFWASC